MGQHREALQRLDRLKSQPNRSKVALFFEPEDPIINLTTWWAWVEMQVLWPEAEAVLKPTRK